MRVFLTRLYYDFVKSRNWKSRASSAVQYDERMITARDEHSIPVRVYRPANKQTEKLPAIIYYHGGGFVIGSLKGYHNLLSYLCEITQSIIISMDYRLAPEHPQPTPMYDAFDVSHWALSNSEELGINSKYILAGDSAGGNLAAVISHSFKNEFSDKLKGQLLICPVTDHYHPEKKSFIENAKEGPLTASMMKWFFKNYLKNGFERSNVNLFPLLYEDFSKLPPALVYTAEKDVLRDDGIEYVKKLEAANIHTVHIQQVGEKHNFPVGQHKVDTGPAFEQMKEWIHARFTS